MLLLSISSASGQSTEPAMKPHVIHLDPAAKDPFEIFTGPPGTVSFRSGYMVLAPKRSVGKHSTKGNEEALIVLPATENCESPGDQPIILAPILWDIVLHKQSRMS